MQILAQSLVYYGVSNCVHTVKLTRYIYPDNIKRIYGYSLNVSVSWKYIASRKYVAENDNDNRLEQNHRILCVCEFDFKTLSTYIYLFSYLFHRSSLIHIYKDTGIITVK